MYILYSYHYIYTHNDKKKLLRITKTIITGIIRIYCTGRKSIMVTLDRYSRLGGGL